MAKMADGVFEAMCEANGLPEPLAEYKFCPKRRWRLDFVWWNPKKVALEIQGGLFVGGRHVRGAALIKEYEKLNEARLAGWQVYFCTPRQVVTGEVFALLKRAFGLDQ